MISKKYKTPLFRTEFSIILYKDSIEVYNHLEGFEHNRPLDNYDGCVFSFKDHIYLILNTGRQGYPTHGIIAHEAKHLVNFIFHGVGVELDLLNDEPEAYLLGWIVDEIHELLNNNNEKTEAN